MTDTKTGLPVPPWALAVVAMLSVQLGSALSVSLISTAGAAGTAWLRLTMGAIILLALARPPLRSVRREDVPTLIALGITTGLVMVFFLAAIDRIPLGTLSPSSSSAHSPWQPYAATTGGRWCGPRWPSSVSYYSPSRGRATSTLSVWRSPRFAVGSGTYIVLTQRVGDRFEGIGSLALTIPIAALTAAVVGIPQAVGHLSVNVLLAAVGLAILLPVLPYILELVALRHMTHTAFGTLMALEPAFGVLLGLLVLHQSPSPCRSSASHWWCLPAWVPNEVVGAADPCRRVPARPRHPPITPTTSRPTPRTRGLPDVHERAGVRRLNRRPSEPVSPALPMTPVREYRGSDGASRLAPLWEVGFMSSRPKIFTRERLTIVGDAFLMSAAAFSAITGITALLIAPTGHQQPALSGWRHSHPCSP